MRELTKKQWLKLFEYNELGGTSYLEDQLKRFESDEIIPAQQMKKVLQNLDVDELHDYDLLCGSYNIYEIFDIIKEFEKNQDFLIKLTELFD